MRMRFANLKTIVLASLVLVPSLALAQYAQGPQPYSAQDPQNYGAPAAQSYYGGQQQGQQPQAAPQNQNLGYQDQRYDPRAYNQNSEYGNQANGYGQQTDGYARQGQYGAPPPAGQEQIYQAPPPLPTYDQPEAPGDGYIWTPGYWAFGAGGYSWVPGAWVLAPYDGALWTPGYWGFGGTGYFWNTGYWGPTIGFYGGINYGFGYCGTGFYGGYWRDHRFFYNREYSRVGFGVRNFYSQRFNGVDRLGPGGRSFTTVNARGGEFRGGTYNARGFQGNGNQGRSFTGETRGGYTPGQSGFGRPAYPGTTYSNMNRGAFGNQAPAQRVPQQSFESRGQGYGAGNVQSFHQPTQSAPRYAAPSAGGQGFHGGGGGFNGGGSHASAPSGGGGGSHGGGHR